MMDVLLLPQVDRLDPSGFVIGRSGNVDVPLDTHFVSVTKERLEGDRLNLTSVDLGVMAEIDLRLIEVHWFRRLIDVIPRGRSAGLKFDGLGMEVIESALLQKRDREYVLIRA